MCVYPHLKGGRVNAHMTDSVCIQPTFWTFKRSIVNSEGEVKLGQSPFVSLLNAQRRLKPQTQ